MRATGLIMLTMMASAMASGCIHFSEPFQLVSSSVLADGPPASPRAPEEVDVFIADDVPPSDCERVALLRAAPVATVVERLREEAGRLGANAVDLRDYRYPDHPQQVGEMAWNAVALYCPVP